MIVDPILPAARVEKMQREGWWRNTNLLEYFDAALAENPDEVAIVDFRAESRQKNAVTYRELNDRANNVALALAHFGIEKQDVVSFQLPNWWEFVVVHLACLRIGAVSNPLMPIFRERELSFMVEYGESKILIVPKHFRGFDHEQMMEGIRDKLPHLRHLFVVGGAGDNSFENALLGFKASGNAEALFNERELNPNDVVLLMYTSGTTGIPKGVMHSANTLIFSVHHMIARCELSEEDNVFMGSPLAHLTGFLAGMWLPIVLKTKAILLDAWNVNLAWRLIHDEQASYTMGATPFLSDLTNSESADDCNSDRFRVFMCGGAPIPRILAENAVSKLDIHLIAVWGMTECGVVTTTELGDSREKVVGTDGKAVAGSVVKVIDEQNHRLPTGLEGRLMQTSPSTFVGYLKKPEAYVLDGEGFFDTGDLATMDEDGYIRITGRSKDIIIRGGENVPVIEVENILYTHNHIVDCAVVAMPDERLGEIGCCFVTLEEGARFTFNDMKAFLIEHKLAKHYFPEHLEVVQAMPRTASGKIQKFELRQIAKTLRDPTP